MELTITVPALVAIIGLVIYFLACNPSNPNTPKYQEIGRIMFFVGLLVFVFNFSRSPIQQIFRN